MKLNVDGVLIRRILAFTRSIYSLTKINCFFEYKSESLRLINSKRFRESVKVKEKMLYDGEKEKDKAGEEEEEEKGTGREGDVKKAWKQL